SVASSARVLQTWGSRPARRTNSAAAGPSRPTGARISTRASRSPFTIAVFLEERAGVADVLRGARQDAGELRQGRAEADAAAAELELADGVLVIAAALLDDGERPPHPAADFE